MARWIAWGLLPLLLQAQTTPGRKIPPIPPGGTLGTRAPAQTAPPGHETEKETIAKCLRDMGSDEVKLRRRAVLILGKYRAPAAQAAVIDALADPDSVVRQSALVSLSEQSLLPPAARAGVLALLRDPDVHIRRIASSLLPEVISGPLALALRAQSGNDAPVTVVRPPAAAGATEELEDQLNAALTDDDAVVRKNVLGIARYVASGLDPDRVAACFRFPDRDVRILALQAYARLPGGDNRRVVALEPLVRDEDAVVRRETARALGRLGPHATPLLKELAGDPDDQVRLQAVKQLVQQRAPEAFDLLADIVQDDRLPADDRASLVPFFAIFRGRAPAVLTGLLADADTLVKAAALRVLSSFPSSAVPTATFLEYLGNASRELRDAAAKGVSRRRQDVTQGHLEAFMRSPFPDVRKLAIHLAGSLPPDQRAELLLEACLDDDTEIRQDALRQIGIFRPPRWETILKRSLEDPDSAIQRAAVEALLARRDMPGIQILTRFLATCKDEALALFIRQCLARTKPPTGRTLRPGRTPRQPRARPAPPTQPARVPRR